MPHRSELSRRSLIKTAAAGTSAAAIGMPYVFSRSASAFQADSINVIMIADPWVDALQTLGAAYQEETGVTVNVESYPYDQTHQREILLGTQQSDAVDVIVLDSPWVGEFAVAGITEDLTERVEGASEEMQYDDFFDSFKAVSLWEGQIVGIPFAPYYCLYHYRTDLFEAEGIEVPTTYAEVRAAADTFTDNPDYPDMFGIGMNNQRGAPVGQAWFEYIWNYGGKPFESNFPGSEEPYADMTPMFSSPEGLEVVNYFADMLQFQPDGALNMAWDERAQAFASGQIAMFSGWSVRTPLLVDPDRSQVADTFAAAVVPSAEGHEPAPPLGGWVTGINAFSGKKDAAWDFIVWLSSPEPHRQFIDLGGPPARYSELEDAELVEKYPWFPVIAESEATAYEDCRPRVPESFQIIDTLGQYLSQALSGDITAEEALENTDNDIRQLLEGAGYEVD